MMITTLHGSQLLAKSHVLSCSHCWGEVAYVSTPGGDLAVECLSASCGKTTPINDIISSVHAPLKPKPITAIAISITPIDDMGLEFSAAIDGWHIGIFESEIHARIAAQNWATTIQFGIVPLGCVPQPARKDNIHHFNQCRACGGAHDIQKCPEIKAALFATDEAPGDDCPDHGPYGGEDCPKCRGFWRQREAL